MKLYKRTIKLNGKRIDRAYEGIFTSLEAAKHLPPEFFETYGQWEDDALYILVLETTADQVGAEYTPVYKASYALRDNDEWRWEMYYQWGAKQ